MFGLCLWLCFCGLGVLVSFGLAVRLCVFGYCACCWLFACVDLCCVAVIY